MSEQRRARRPRLWYARDCGFTADAKIEALADEFGPQGALLIEEVFALAKMADQRGAVAGARYGVLAKRAFARNAAQAKAILEMAGDLGVFEISDLGTKAVDLTIPRWARWQISDPTNADRQATKRESNAQDNASNNAKNTPASTEDSKTTPPNPPPGDHPDFSGWLADHQQVTGRTPPATGTKARSSLASSYAARRSEGYTDARLRMATRGAHRDDYRRENGYDSAASVLKPTKVHDLAENGSHRPVAERDHAADLAEKLRKAEL